MPRATQSPDETAAPIETPAETPTEEATPLPAEPTASAPPAPDTLDAVVTAPTPAYDEDGASAAEDTPTLQEAFDVLARAMVPLLAENAVAQEQLHQARAMHSDGNIEVPWARLLELLAELLGIVLKA